jgi:hypothetical protein
VRAQGVVGHQLLGHLFGELGIEPASDIDRRQFPVLAHVIGPQFRAFQLEVGLFGVCLRVHGHVFARGHRHRPGHQAGDTRHHYVAVTGMRRRDTEHQARRRKDPVVGAQHRRAQPADACGAVLFRLGLRHYSSSCALSGWSSVKPETGYIPPQSDNLQEPDAHDNHDDHIQNRFDAGGHGNVPVDEVQPNPYYDQQDDNIH